MERKIFLTAAVPGFGGVLGLSGAGKGRPKGRVLAQAAQK
jgi:hypothetical protein